METELLLNAFFFAAGIAAGALVGWLRGTSEGIRLADRARGEEWREFMD